MATSQPLLATTTPTPPGFHCFQNGTTPLILAAYSQDMGILQLLLTRGAVVKMRNKVGGHMLNPDSVLCCRLTKRWHHFIIQSGINPLIAAASIGWTDGVRALLQKGASITSNSRVSNKQHTQPKPPSHPPPVATVAHYTARCTARSSCWWAQSDSEGVTECGSQETSQD